jgi:hypothetical protein
MNRLRVGLERRRRLRAACASFLLVAGVVSVSACGEASTGYDYETASHHEPAKLEPIEGTDVQRVIFDAEGARRVDLQTVPIRQAGKSKVIPYKSVVYDAEGNEYAYTSPEPLTFVRREIDVDHVTGDSAVLSDGPPAGTEVVTVGAAQVYGTEFEVSH